MSLFTALVLVAGCYTLQPATQAAPEVGSVVALDVNDAGRVALGGSIGPEIGQIEGRLISQENGGYLLAVSSVRFLRGGEQVWTGERVRVSREHVGNTYERRFDKGRTIALSAVFVAGVAAIILSRDLIGFGREPGEEPGTGNPGGEAVRIPLKRLITPHLLRSK
jgi:hypothetical protein